MLLRASIWLLGVATLLSTASFASSEDAEQAADEKMLREAGVATDGPGLLAFFKARTLNEADRERLTKAVRHLGDDDFNVREKATAELKAAGRAALPLLRPALRDADPEVVFRARRCLEGIEHAPELSLQACAARLLAIRRPAQTAEALLAYLPIVDDEYVRDAILRTLAAIGIVMGKPEPIILAAAKDAQPARRVAAAYVLARAGSEQRETLSQLLTDPDARVRFQAAAESVRARNKAGVPPLVALLSEGPRETAWQAEDLLCRIASDRTPSASLGAGDEESRKKCRAAWEAWWQDQGPKVDLSRLDIEETALGLTVICDCDVQGQFRIGSVWECGSDGKARWQINQVKNPADVQLLPGGRLLVAECQGFLITERDRQGKVLWSQTVDNYPVSCQRLANGNTFIATYSELGEVTRDGKWVYSYKKPASIYCAQKLRNGNILYAHSGGAIVELDQTGKEVRTVAIKGLSAWASVELLPNGRYLVAQYSQNRIVEVDAVGKEYWECNVQTPAWCTRLPNGNTLVASTEGRCVVEIDRSGNEVWKQASQGRPFRVRRH
jgi:HEAT repeat protein